MRTTAQLPEESARPLNPNRKQVVVPKPGRHRRPMTAVKSQTEKTTKRKKVWLTILAVVVCLAILATAAYFIKVLIDSKYFFCKRSFKFIPIDQACDGKSDCAGGEDEVTCVSTFTVNSTFPVRLLTAKSVLQVYSSGTGWRSVCTDGWTAEHTQTACKQLGYTNKPSSSNEPVGTLPVQYRVGPFTAVRPGTGNTPVHQATNTRSVCQTGSVVSLSCSDCGKVDSRERIVGGTDTVIEEWPWQVSLLQSGQHTCGGALVAPQWVITAAHCFSGSKNELSRWKVVSGQTYLGSLGGSSVDRIIINGQYDNARNDYDIAIMRLHSPLSVGESRRPACLPPKAFGLNDGDMVAVTGWGYLEEDGKVSSRLQQAAIPLIDRTKCSSPYVYGSAITERMLCAGYLEGGVDACQGDSGGPLVHISSTKYYLVGVVSWGVGCARRGKPGVYCDVEEMTNWIRTVIEKNP
ncbi:transmembrane protease serine 4a isoform X2 [Periophthalmus magnuspinnatus]|uniref:transmembrane protease serine 4a isoform X2 n=1 Tax=Periophthalmus magnuspinnatus TaxID=409849 RepID=UPI002436392D|nr:transmembrane protease serine 4a isoform X2 [Periophthalmus magnuspinnatus]